jgi:hypothetical protein
MIVRLFSIVMATKLFNLEIKFFMCIVSMLLSFWIVFVFLYVRIEISIEYDCEELKHSFNEKLKQW